MKCPKCGADLEYLVADYPTEAIRYRVNKRGEESRISSITRRGDIVKPIDGWRCPECLARLADTKEEAVNWLKPMLERRLNEVLDDFHE